MAQNKQRGLGKGLSAIFMDNEPDVGLHGQNSPLMVRISDIEPRKDQPRKIFDAEALASLADSIAANGLIQPIVVRQTESGMYQIIAGERRWRACKLAGLIEVPVIVMNLDDKSTAEVALIENLQREDLNPLEEAKAYRSLIDDYGMTQEDISKRIGKSRSAVANSLRLLDLPEEVLKLVSDGDLSAGHARTLLALRCAEDIPNTAYHIVSKGLSVRAAEELVKRLNAMYEAKQEETAEKEETTDIEVDYIANLERTLSSILGRKVKICGSENSKRSKTITLEYSDNEDLDKIIKLLCGDSI